MILRSKSMGDVALGFVTVAHYDWNHASALNREFVRDYAEISGGRGVRGTTADAHASDQPDGSLQGFNFEV